MKETLFVIFLVLTLTTKAQSIDVATERFPTVKKLIIKSFNGCVKKGYRTVYLFDDKGQAIESSSYLKRKLLAKYKYVYNDKGLLTEKIQTYSINDKKRTDTTRFIYEFDLNARLLSKSKYFGIWTSTETYQDFDANGFPTTVISTFDNKTTVFRKEYNSIRRETRRQKVENDTIITFEENRYNQYGDIIYSILPTVVGEETNGLALFIGGNRHSAVEKYEYTYDSLNRWTEKYLVFDGKKVLHEKRLYK